ncbi:MAG: branched-chain amino acid ABC transporter permease [Rhodospirillales bacterium]|nr:branched-chain amino acid ABC transporter permease [Rhodospirillales bacterium]MBT4038634.1 branched-chain amino acid ABC transporter permease [Rhodospirillales bacterium]MBT4627606.1 branched-chain amino acid ABC transporter permease [Rhodospirillales bacterium]MBT5350642.1 branched-chain amino acid ABC transporter permease [Rhodospirillales bacterium]MBT5521499.1 branched-chain amino acid ABC transporter permease [Rhodospirillales bacterium]
MSRKKLYLLLLVGLMLLAPVLMPAFKTQLAMLMLMITFALTWDIMGGQMGYNSFGNIVFFGTGMYVTAVIQRDLFFTAEEYESLAGSLNIINGTDYLTGLFLGLGVSVVVCVILAAILGAGILKLRGHYFAICTLGLGIAAAEIAAGIDYIGAGSGLVPPTFPHEDLGDRGYFFYYYFLTLAAATFTVLSWLYKGQFGLAINAIRDDEDKAEAMGIHTTRYKTLAWCISAFFLALAGGALGNMVGFIDPTEVAFAGATFGVWMVLMAILGGKGTIWGPVIGATVFHIMQELFWTYLFGWQRVALGILVISIVVFFPEGIMGFIRDRWPELLGHKVDLKSSKKGSTP